jgi:hypothetical protein
MILAANLLQGGQARLVGLSLPISEVALLGAEIDFGIHFLNAEGRFHAEALA